MAHRVFLLLGSNLGDRVGHLQRAVVHIHNLVGNVRQRSAIFESAAQGFHSHTTFLNCALEIESSLSPHECLAVLMSIERDMGRKRNGRMTSRSIDIDIVFYDEFQVSDKNLTIPHPRMHLRRFALMPLYQLAPDYVHPEFNKSVKELLSECPDKSEVSLLLQI